MAAHVIEQRIDGRSPAERELHGPETLIRSIAKRK